MDDKLTVIGFVLIVTVILLGVSLPGLLLVDESTAVRALEIQGFSDVRITGRHWFLVGMRGCSDSDVVKFDATATNPRGDRVELFVCAGWPFKGATIRTR